VERPYVIYHMTTSLDGKVTGDFLGHKACQSAVEVYYQINRDYKADAYACGRVTMEGSFTGGWYPNLQEFAGAQLPCDDYAVNPKAGFYAVAFDRRGRLGWKTDRIIDQDPGYGGAHIIEVLCQDAPTPYLAYLQSIGVSYIFAGKQELDLPLALHKLKRLFGINTLLLEGGSILGGAFQQEGLIDELSLVTAPIVADTGDKPLFWQSRQEEYHLKEVKQYHNRVLWFNFIKQREE